MFRHFSLMFAFAIATAGFSQTALPPAQVDASYKVQIAWAVNGAVCPCRVTFKGLPPWLKGSSDGLLMGKPGPEPQDLALFSMTVTDTEKYQAVYQFTIKVMEEAPPQVVRAGGDIKSAAGNSGNNSPSAGKEAPQSPSGKAAQPNANSADAGSGAGGASDSKNAASSNSGSESGDTTKKDAAANGAAAGNEIQPAPTPDAKAAKTKEPWIYFNEPIAAGDNFVRGAAQPGALVELTRCSDGDCNHGRLQVLETTADENGRFAIPLPGAPLQRGEELSLRQFNKGQGSAPFVRKVVPYDRNGEEARAILGYQQAGASAAQHDQNWFFDFYISRPIGGSDDSPSPWRWWGNVRVASYPQQGDVPVATFASSFIQQFGQLKVNQLAQAAEFVTGPEYKLHRWDFSRGRSENTRQQFTLGVFGGIGATGPLDPSSNATVFETPAATSPDRARFVSTFPKAAGSQFIAFVTPDRDSFLRQYFAGIRLTTNYLDTRSHQPLMSAPAIVSFSAGQNEVVTGGRLRGVVFRTEAFYPLPFFSRAQDKKGALAAIYLFGSAQMHGVWGAKNIDPFILKPRPDIAPSDPTVAVVTAASNRDVYRIGIGVDFLHMIMALTHPPTDSSAATTIQKNTSIPSK
jgi:hypothetical protein